MAQIKFGTSQLSNPTPSKVSMGINIFIAVGGVIIGWIGTADFITSYNAKVTQSIIGLAVSLAVVLKPFFGVETSLKNVPIDDVKEMESTPKN